MLTVHYFSDDYYKALNRARRAKDTSNMESADEGPESEKIQQLGRAQIAILVRQHISFRIATCMY